MDFYDVLLDVCALHGREAAEMAGKHIIKEFLANATEQKLSDRRDEITADLLARKLDE